jgi:superfamily II DNA or RNA helicase
VTATLAHTLRDYQRDAITALHADWGTGLERLGIGLPTGTGKTHVMCALADEFAKPPGGHVLVLVHRDQLVVQTEEKMRASVTGRTTVGVVKGDRNVVNADVVVASIHTVRSSARLAQLRRPSLIIVDEAHVSMSASYERVFAAFPGVQVAGFSATWIRSDGKALGDFWQKISYQRSIRWAIREGHLVPPRGIAMGVPDDLMANAVVRGGDYTDKSAGEAVTVEVVRDNVVRGYQEHGQDRSAVLFAPTKAAAEYFRYALLEAGIPSTGVYDTVSGADRKKIFAAYRRREIKVLTTCTALAEGWDNPWCSVAIMARPTKHKGLYIQQVGRVLRPWPGKSEALVLDVVGGSQGMSLNLDAILTESNGEDSEPDEDRDPLPEGQDQAETLFHVGKGTRPVDLFAGTPAQWLTTHHGVPFVPTEKHYYFLVPFDDGTWSVGQCSVERGLRDGRWIRQGLASEEALNLASIVAVDEDHSYAASDASWRAPKHKPSLAQISYARANMLPIREDDTRSTLGDRITVAKASVTLATVYA